ncbi:uncharacterized protein PFL1_00843 [Pseudozyma flocculosa PF-1]|uniref:Coilin n=1 Tax=Pseudozyma flocculosa TaxID=84751 RepID=A0A5C3F300_9BASI|nr:uncharacterized protein PFL1_00843 [Pseudozyma flocculosa PF-1]EPQ31510.1 hypothetical protein PFL1_00843 [Pseudozyma flocculosa PF-1]SPO38702.1 uncharacterized protein PSFLO_04181 [Pseudozyma flocculosa]
MVKHSAARSTTAKARGISVSSADSASAVAPLFPRPTFRHPAAPSIASASSTPQQLPSSSLRIKISTQPPLPISRFLTTFNASAPYPFVDLAEKILSSLARVAHTNDAVSLLARCTSESLSLSIDGFEIIPDDVVATIRDGDLIDVSIHPQHALQLTSSSSKAAGKLSRASHQVTERPRKRQRRRSTPDSSSSASTSSSVSSSTSSSSDSSSSRNSHSSGSDPEPPLDAEASDALLQANRIAALMRSELGGRGGSGSDSEDDDVEDDDAEEGQDEYNGEADDGEGYSDADRGGQEGTQPSQDAYGPRTPRASAKVIPPGGDIDGDYDIDDFPKPPPGLGQPMALPGSLPSGRARSSVKSAAAVTMPVPPSLGSLGGSSSVAAAMAAFEARKKASGPKNRAQPRVVAPEIKAAPRSSDPIQLPDDKNDDGATSSVSSSKSGSDDLESSASSDTDGDDDSSSGDAASRSPSISDSAPSEVVRPARVRAPVSATSGSPDSPQVLIPPGQGTNRTKRRNQKKRQREKQMRQARAEADFLAAKDRAERRSRGEVVDDAEYTETKEKIDAKGENLGWAIDLCPSRDIDTIVARPTLTQHGVEQQASELPPGGGSLGLDASDARRAQATAQKLAAAPSRQFAGVTPAPTLEEIAARMLASRPVGPVTRKTKKDRAHASGPFKSQPSTVDTQDGQLAIPAAFAAAAATTSATAAEFDSSHAAGTSIAASRPIASNSRIAAQHHKTGKKWNPVPPPSQRPPSEIPSSIKVTSIDCVEWYEREYELMQQQQQQLVDEAEADEQDEDEATRAYRAMQREVKEKLAARKREEALQKHAELAQQAQAEGDQVTLAHGAPAQAPDEDKEDEREISVEILAEKTLKIRPQINKVQGRGQRPAPGHGQGQRPSQSQGAARHAAIAVRVDPTDSVTELDYGDPDDSAAWMPRKKTRIEAAPTSFAAAATAALSEGTMGKASSQPANAGGAAADRSAGKCDEPAETEVGQSIGRMQQLLEGLQKDEGGGKAGNDDAGDGARGQRDRDDQVEQGQVRGRGQDEDASLTELERARKRALATLKSRSLQP